MRKFIPLGCITAGLLAAGSAAAADMPAAVYKAPIAPPVYNWTGFYAGANAGVSAGVEPLTQTSAFPPFPPGIVNQSSHDAFGALAGAQAGYNWQAGQAVFGVEGDFQWSGQRSDTSCLTFCDFNFQTPTAVQFDSVSQRIPWFATVRGRIGYAAGPTLFYFTAGAAFADVKTTYSTTELTTFSGTTSNRVTGVAVGGGVEAAVFGNWTAKIEYLYLDFGNVTANFPYSVPGGGFGPPGPFPVLSQVSGNVSDHILRAGLNYRFGGPAPANALAMMPTKAPVLPPAAYDWSGFYVGGNFGYGVGRDTAQEDIFGVFGQAHQQFTLVPHGVLGGVQAGYNVMLANRFVLGVEGDYQLADQKDTACFSWCFTANTTYSQSIKWFATARGRAGIAAGPALFYLTGGGAWTSIGTTASQTNSITTIAGTTYFNSSASFSDQKTGWVAGFGAEGAIGGGWTAKVEYLYLDFGSIAHAYPAPIPTNLLDTNIHISTAVHDSVFRAGVSYHFAPGAPLVAARY